MVSHTLILNAVNYGVLRVVDAVYGDTARQLLIIPRDINIEGATAARVNFTRANGTNYYADGVINGNTVTVPMEQMLTCVGQTHCNLDVTLSDGTIQSFEFVVSVHAANGGAPATPEEAITLAELQGEVEDLSEDLNDNYYDKEEVDELIGEAGTLKPGYAPDTTRTEESTAGAKGWYIKEWDEAGEYLYLCNADGTFPDMELFSVGDILSCKAGFSANYCWEITHLEVLSEDEWMMIVTRTDNFALLTQGAPFDPASHLYGSAQPGYVWIPEKPGIGSVEIGTGAMAIGTDNRANEWGALAIGDGNEVDGRYGFADGQFNKVAYSSAALGHNNNVYGYDSIAVGGGNTTRNWRSAAFGQTNSSNAVNGFITGHGNNATKDAHDGISIRGTYAINQSTDTFIDVVGNGTDNDHRSNALAVAASTGSLRIKGDIFVNCAANSSGGTNLRTAIDGKEDKGTYSLIGEFTVSADRTGDYELSLPSTKRCVLLWLSIPRTVTENYRLFVNDALNQQGGQISVTAGTTGVTNTKMKFDATHGVLESEWARQEGLGGYVTKTTYAGYANEPVITSGITKIILRNISNDVIRAGTKIKIYAF